MRPRTRLSILAVLVCMASGACEAVVTDNPNFEHGADTSADATDSDGCEPGNPNGLDCDDFPGCESDRRDPETCGTCERSCEIAGQWGTCEMQMGSNNLGCEATLELPAVEDVYILDNPTDHNAEGELRLDVFELPLSNAYIAGPDLALLPEGVTLLDAQLRLTSLTDGSPVVGHAITEDWSANLVDWTSRPLLTPAPDFMFDAALGENHVDVTALVTSWHDGAPNYGVALLPSTMGASSFLASESGAGPIYELMVQW